MKAIGEVIKERNIQLDTMNPVVQGGFTQIPNLVLREPALSVGAKITYAMFLSYAWHNKFCFPGQDRLAVDIGLCRSRITQLIAELDDAALVAIKRRGQGKTNVYTIHFQVRSRQVRQNQIPEMELTRATSETAPERDIILATNNAMVQGGFTQAPNFILKAADLSAGAKITYAMFLSYAWNNDFCFPGQDRLAVDMGLSQSRVSQLVIELKNAGLIDIQHRGQGKTNVYTIHFQVKRSLEQFQRQNSQMLIS